jgi:serine/threonine protein phosphatase PrpC
MKLSKLLIYLTKMGLVELTQRTKSSYSFLRFRQQKSHKKKEKKYISGSTAVITHITKDKIKCTNCGDSRVILIGDKGIVKISRDHKPE